MHLLKISISHIKTVFVILLFHCLLQGIHGQQQTLWQPWYITPRTGTQHVDLNGKWELSYMDTTISDLTQLTGRKDPFETVVPNSIDWSLFKAGKLLHPYYNKNSVLYKWTDEKAWYCNRSFELPSGTKDKYVFLCFEGVDYFSRVWINDSLLGKHEGMFGGPNVEVSRFLKEGGANKVTVEVLAGNWGNKAIDVAGLPRAVSGRIDFTNRPGFNPRASGRIIKPWVISGGVGGEAFFSLGMWQGVRMEIVPKIHLERPYLVTKDITPAGGLLHLSAEIFSNDHSLTQQLHPWIMKVLRYTGWAGPVLRVPNAGPRTGDRFDNWQFIVPLVKTGS